MTKAQRTEDTCLRAQSRNQCQARAAPLWRTPGSHRSGDSGILEQSKAEEGVRGIPFGAVCQGEHRACLGVLVTLTQTRDTWKEGPSVETMPPWDGLVSKSVRLCGGGGQGVIQDKVFLCM